MRKILLLTIFVTSISFCKASDKLEGTHQDRSESISKKRCELKPDPGPCRAAMPGFFFNSNTGKCQEFMYGGCQGVLPFSNLNDCEKTCY